ncbi:Transcriptional regulator, LysR family [hydrothermal vent metagenome]|uniref:Transcriptional regulator, LysR family n=1 Tax=hydrothermal vent metagenome TaxID=652676 RepID=A0A3B0ZV03_9ZZZZ
MDIANLQAFVAVAKYRSFSIASKKLFLTQPAISKRISGLETQLGARLFDRINRKISLTQAGLSLLPRAHQLILDIEDCKRAVTNLSSQVSGTLSIGTSHHIGLHRLPPVLSQFTSNHPNVELNLQFMDSEAACREIVQGNLEMAIVTLPLLAIDDIHTKLIWPDPLSVIVTKQHPLANLKTVSLKQLAEHNAVLPAQGTFTREIIEDVMSTQNIQLKVNLTTNYLETINMLVSVGLGWSILPNKMLSNDIKTINVKGLNISRQLGIVWHSKRTLSNAASSMHTILENQLKK